MGTAVVFAGGPVEDRHPPPRALDAVHPDLVVAVDSGLELAVSLGWAVDLVVGDMDSVAPEALEHAELAGSTVRRHPADKDATDLELAMDEVVGAGMRRSVVVGSPSGRMDHLLGAAAVLASARFAQVEVDAWFGGAALFPVHGRRSLTAQPGAVVSLIPMHGPAGGVRTTGLRWPLVGETLDAGSTRGMSNEFVGTGAEVSLDAGCVLVVVPDDTTVGGVVDDRPHGSTVAVEQTGDEVGSMTGGSR